MTGRRLVDIWIRVLVGGLFLFSGTSKLIVPIEFFQMSIGAYEVFSDPLIVAVSHVVPWLEVVAGLYVLVGFETASAAGLLAVLTFGFQVVLASALVRDLPLDECGCFGGSIKLTLQQSLVMDTLLLLALIWMATSDSPTPSGLDGWLAARERRAPDGR